MTTNPLETLETYLGEIITLAGSDIDCRDQIIEQADAALIIVEGLDNPTPVQKQTLDFIKEFYAAHKFMPSYGEIADHFGLASKSGAHRLVWGLVERELIIAPIPRRARSMRIPA